MMYATWKTLMVASVLAVLITAGTYFYQTGPQFRVRPPYTDAQFYRGFPFPYFTTTVIDIVGAIHQFSPFGAAVDFLVILPLVFGILLALGRLSEVKSLDD